MHRRLSKMMGEVIKTWLEILTSSGVVLGVIWKFLVLPLKNHVKYISNLLRQIPTIIDNSNRNSLIIQEQDRKITDIYKKIYPNGGSSLDDKLNKIMGILHYQSESTRVSWKLNPDPICRANATGSVIFVNFAWLSLAGFSSPEEAYGIGWLRAIHPEDRNAVKQQWEETVKSCSALHSSFRMKNVQTGKTTLMEVQCSLIQDPTDNVIEYFAVLTPKSA
jgi:PAS domain S-box-containing protein